MTGLHGKYDVSPPLSELVMKLLGAIFWFGVLALICGLPTLFVWLAIAFIVVLIVRVPFAFFLGAILGISLFGGDDC